MRNSLLREGPEYQPLPRVSARLARLEIVNLPVQDPAYDNLPALVRDQRVSNEERGVSTHQSTACFVLPAGDMLREN